MTPQNRQIPKLHTRAAFVPATLNEQARTVELTWSTGAQVRRFDWWTEKQWIEELSLDPAHVRLDRLNSGAPVLPNHKNYSLTDVIGVVERAWLVGNEGRALVRFSDREDVQTIFNEVKAGILRNISVGYKINKLEEQKDRQDDLKVFRAIDWEPMEISLVTIPADAGAQFRAEGENYSVTIINHEETAMTGTVEDKATDKIRAEVPTESVKPAVDVDAVRAEATKQERKRQTFIRDFCRKASLDDKVAEDLIERGVSEDAAQQHILGLWSERVDSQCSRADTSVTYDERDKFVDGTVGAVLQRAGIGERQADAANPWRGFTLRELARECLQRAGTDARGMDAMSIVGRAFTQSGSDFPVLLENAMHKALLAAYATVALSWMRFARISSVTDFRAHHRYRTGSFGNLDALNELGEFKNKTIPDGEKASITIGTKGNIINISRQAIINDDLGAFIGLAQELSRAAGRSVESDVYALLASNPLMSDGIALFHASHDNLAAAGSVVTMAAIDAARVAMASQMDISGNDFLDLRPAIWLGPLSQGGNARTVNDAQYDPDTANKLQKPNTVRGLFSDVVDSPRISGTEWYAFANPNEAPVIDVAFLDGNQEPFLEVQDGFTVDGARYKVRLDYGVAAIDYRGAYKNPGAA